MHHHGWHLGTRPVGQGLRVRERERLELGAFRVSCPLGKNTQRRYSSPSRPMRAVMWYPVLCYLSVPDRPTRLPSMGLCQTDYLSNPTDHLKRGESSAMHRTRYHGMMQQRPVVRRGVMKKRGREEHSVGVVFALYARIRDVELLSGTIVDLSQTVSFPPFPHTVYPRHLIIIST